MFFLGVGQDLGKSKEIFLSLDFGCETKLTRKYQNHSAKPKSRFCRERVDQINEDQGKDHFDENNVVYKVSAGTEALKGDPIDMEEDEFLGRDRRGC